MWDEYQDKVSIHYFTTTKEMVASLTSNIEQDILQVVSSQGSFVLAVSGGRSPIPLFQCLAENQHIPWGKGKITLIDERWLPPTDPDSNEHLVRKHLLTGLAENATFLPLHRDEDIQSTTSELDLFFNTLPINIAVLGMGLDGHTASLFPSSPEYEDNLVSEKQFAIANPKNAPHARITLTLSALVKIPQLYLFIPGNEKIERFKELLSKSDISSPIIPLIRQRSRPIQVYTCP